MSSVGVGCEFGVLRHLSQRSLCCCELQPADKGSVLTICQIIAIGRGGNSQANAKPTLKHYFE